MLKRFYAVLLCEALVSATFALGNNGGVLPGTGSLFGKKDTITIWYTDESMTDYLAARALDYYEETGKRVVPVLASGLEYLENIHKVEMDETGAPDLYIVSNDLLEKAWLSGLASPITDPDDLVNNSHFSEPALHAVTYKDEKIGYPLYFETSVFLYNESYLKDWAKQSLENEANAAEGEEAMEMVESAQSDAELEALVSANSTTEDSTFSQEQIEQRETELIPTTMDGILSFANEYDAPESVESVFKWDVSDIFYNYFIVGDSISVGGENGDNPEILDVNNQNAIDCMTLYQQLNQFFSIDTRTVTYDSVLQEFMDGKIVFTVATTDAIARLEKAKLEGKFNYNYAMAPIPRVSDTLDSRSLSVTNAIAINGFGEKQEEANEFASYLTKSQDTSFYTLTGKIAARNDVSYDMEAVSAAMTEYAASIPMPKMMQTSNFWAQLEIAFTKIWTGSDVTEILNGLSEQMKKQLGE